MRCAAIVATTIFLGCGNRPAPGPLPRAGATDAGVDAAPIERSAACPASYAAVPAGQACDASRAQLAAGATATGLAGLSCAYPEGACACAAPSVCSGVEQEPEFYERLPIEWRCAPTPPAFRPDGCPGTTPSGACSDEGRACSYGDCCFIQLTCRGGQWIETGGGCPP